MLVAGKGAEDRGCDGDEDRHEDGAHRAKECRHRLSEVVYDHTRDQQGEAEDSPHVAVQRRSGNDTTRLRTSSLKFLKEPSFTMAAKGSGHKIAREFRAPGCRRWWSES